MKLSCLVSLRVLEGHKVSQNYVAMESILQRDFPYREKISKSKLQETLLYVITRSLRDTNLIRARDVD